jgi:hypothetical protein
VPRTSALQLPSRRRCQLFPGVISETCRGLGAEMARHLPEAQVEYLSALMDLSARFVGESQLVR